MTQVAYHTLIKEMPENERPRERLALYGAGALSTVDLMAITLRIGSKTENAVGLAQRLLKDFQNLAGLTRASVRELCEVPGIGPAKAAQIQAALELGRRMILSSGDARPQITGPEDAANLMMAAMSTETQEQLRVMLLDSKHRLLRTVQVYVGNVNASMVRVSEVFQHAIKDNAAAIIVAHNHPSGDPTPSTEDIRVTEVLVRASKLLDIELLDHLVIGHQKYVSLKDRGLGF